MEREVPETLFRELTCLNTATLLKIVLTTCFPPDLPECFRKIIPRALVPVQFFQAGLYFFKVNNINSRTMYEICLKLIKTPE